MLRPIAPPTRRRVVPSIMLGLAVLLPLLAACADQGETPPTAPSVTTPSLARGGKPGAGAPASGVRAYAYVTGGAVPTIDPARSLGFSAATRVGPGTTCLRPSVGVSPATTPALVGLAGDALARVSWNQEPEPYGCPPDEYRVKGEYLANQAAYDGPFVILVP